MSFHENWEGKQVILVILAHPDDPEFFCGATIARWAKTGHEIHYLLFSKGDKGSSDPKMTSEQLMEIRVKEQRAAGDVLGVNTITYLDKEDGYITADLQNRRDIVSAIRKVKPQIIVSCDPTNLNTRDGYINHPDHRSVGQQVIDAIFPGAGNSFFFPELLTEKLPPHKVNELWLSIPNEANTVIDVTETWPMKLQALTKHASQVDPADRMMERMNKRSNLTSIKGKKVFEERFKRIIFK